LHFKKLPENADFVYPKISPQLEPRKVNPQKCTIAKFYEPKEIRLN
jgi:hypothetical protein